MQNELRNTIGIDFGTTNSSVAFAQDGQVRMVSFPLGTGGETFSSRSLLYLERQMHAPRKPVSVWTGPLGIEKYLAHDGFSDEAQGRLIQSLKSYLSARTLTGTEIFGKQYRFEDLVARILANLRLRASEALGFEVKRAIAGRPVMFVGAENEDDNAFAENRLRSAFEQAGFTDVTFAMEPVAAAYAYESAVERDELVLIGDFGGGTTDFSLLRVGPAARASGQLQVLGNSGVGIAGDAFDARIVRRLISPALGSESVTLSAGKKLPVLPAWVYANLERWHTLSFLRTHATMDMLRMAEKRAAAKKAPEREQIAALITIVEHDLGYRLHQAVQRVKVELSRHEQAEFVLHAELLHLRAAVTRTQFEEWISPELERMSESLDGLLQDTGIAAHQVDRVFLTGGTSLVPAVRRIFTSRFGEDRVQSGEAFTSVAYGLALMAAQE
ncbi:Hsp70 family protein [Silvibacterium dinghuense]|uniref:Hsp70 family protein n=1 Tax=Silvibacterium dinghuense TaxID=1560006 RepID=UPI00199044F9|nr:Hsp70 family protein [Silvibacterium dinghuense]GGH04577.1 hsp70 family protein [Silvibacterium dinghuense]